jgi:hypothetical protein
VAASTGWTKRFEIGISILTALVTILSALVAWRAALAGDAAGNADAAGIAASITREEARVLSSATTYQEYGAYTSYLRSQEIADQAQDAISATPDDEQEKLQELETERFLNQVQANRDLGFFNQRYLRPDRSYLLERQLGQSEADKSERKDTDPEPHFSLAERLRTKSNLMVGMLILMAGALWFYTMAAEIKHGIRYMLGFLGVLSMLVGVFGTIIIEVL